MKLRRRYKINSGQLTAFRKQLGLTQTEFWQALGLTQSGGSRYENGERNLPPIVVGEIIRVFIEGASPIPHVMKHMLPEFRCQLGEAAALEQGRSPRKRRQP